MRKRYQFIDIAKGLAILLVVYGHMLTHDDWGRKAIYSFHIPLFFVLSGLMLSINTENKRTMGEIVKRQAKNLFLPYCFFSVFFMCWDIIRYLKAPSMLINVLFYDIVYTISGYGINVLWYIITLFSSSILICIMLNKIGEIWTCIIGMVLGNGAIWIATLFNLHFEVASNTTKIISIFVIGFLRPFSVMPFIISGYIIKRYLFRLYSKRTGVIAALSILCTMSILAEWLNLDVSLVIIKVNPLWTIFTVSLFSIAGMIALSMLLEKNKIASKFFSYWGRNSLLLMITHEYTGLREEIQRFVEGKLGSINEATALLVAFIVIMIVEYIVVILFSPLIDSALKKCWKITDNCITKYTSAIYH